MDAGDLRKGLPAWDAGLWGWLWLCVRNGDVFSDNEDCGCCVAGACCYARKQPRLLGRRKGDDAILCEGGERMEKKG